MSIAYKILTREQLNQLLADKTFRGAPIDLADGYIHLSTRAQVRETLDKHFAGHDDIHIAAVDLDTLGGCVKWEVSRGGALFPHIYAELPLASVVAHAPVDYDASGRLQLPAT